MIRFLLLAALVTGWQAHATSGFLDEAPKKLKKSVIGQCPRYTSKTSVAGEMIQNLLDLPAPFGKQILGADGNAFKLLNSAGELQVDVTIRNTPGINDGVYTNAGFVCETKDGSLQVKLIYETLWVRTENVIKVKKAQKPNQVLITSLKDGKTGIFTVR